MKKYFLILIILFHFILINTRMLLAIRNPFDLKNNETLLNKNKKQKIELIGICRSENKMAAVLKFGKNQCVGFLGDKIFGYKIKNLTFEKIELLNQNSTKKLILKF